MSFTIMYKLARDFTPEMSDNLIQLVVKNEYSYGRQKVIGREGLPNPMYGDWEKAIVENRRNLTQEESKRMKMQALSEGKVQE